MSRPAYPTTPPFHPGVRYPEYTGEVGDENSVYDAVRESLRLLGLDQEHFGRADWNPLKGIVRPGDRVVLKPNFLNHEHKYRHGEWDYVITHGAVIRAVLDYVMIALAGRGQVSIADGPQFDGDWDRIVSQNGTKAVCEYYRGIASSPPVSLLDLRWEWWPDVRGDVTNRRESLPGDRLGSQQIDLTRHSALGGHGGGGRYFGSDYDQAETNYHHQAGRHEYLVSRTCTSADVFINLPKMKTHKKVGTTLCLKNLVGINTGRNWLPHHTDGYPHEGGDQFPEPSALRSLERLGIRWFEQRMLAYPRLVSPLFRLAKRAAKPVWGESHHVIRQGNWHGNDTCWRMVHDINTCLLYSDGESFPTATPKRYLGLVDGVRAGEGDGPAAPDVVEAGVIVAGCNPVAIDAAATWIMGFDPTKLPVIRAAFDRSSLPFVDFRYDDISIISNDAAWTGHLRDLDPDSTLRFRPHFGWNGAIELPHRVAVAM